MKIFSSSTYIDLKDFSQKAIEIINRYKCVPLAMEFFMAQPEEQTKVCEKEIKACDILLRIYAHRYSFIRKGNDKSITQQEYGLVKKLNKPVSVLLLMKIFNGNPNS